MSDESHVAQRYSSLVTRHSSLVTRHSSLVTCHSTTSAKPVESVRVRVLDLALQIGGQPSREGLCRCVKLPMWVIGREHQQLVRAKLLDDLLQMLCVGRAVDRLGGQADMVVDVLRGQPLDPRHLAPKPFPLFVEP